MRPPVPLVIARFQKWGLKGRLLLLLLLGQLMTVGALVVRGNDCVRAHDAHDFSIDLWSQPMSS
jgi:hypothetical protein